VDEELVDRVRGIWRDVLGQPEVPLEANFFDLGGDSRALVVLYERLSALTSEPLAAADLFEHSTVLAQARLLGAAADTATGTAGPDRSALLARRQARQ
jgi:hypothetical protein